MSWADPTDEQQRRGFCTSDSLSDTPLGTILPALGLPPSQGSGAAGVSPEDDMEMLQGLLWSQAGKSGGIHLQRRRVQDSLEPLPGPKRAPREGLWMDRGTGQGGMASY